MSRAGNLSIAAGIFLAIVVGAPSAAGAAAATPFELHIPVIYYHHVVCPPPDTSSPELYICPEQLRAQLTYLRNHAWRTITADRVADLLATRTCPKPRRFVVSFDDGPIDQFTQAAPILESLSMRGTFFVIARRTGKPIEMSYEQMRDLVVRGHSFGNHTLTHANIRLADAAKLREQIEGAQQVLFDQLGFRPRTFAYPYGRFSPAAVDAVRASGLELGFTTMKGASESTAEPLLSPRIYVAPTATGARVAEKLQPFANGCASPT